MKKLKRPVEEIRAELLVDPATQGIASKLGIPVEQYVEKVLDYAQNPEKQPQLNQIDLREEHEKDVFEEGSEKK